MNKIFILSLLVICAFSQENGEVVVVPNEEIQAAVQSPKAYEIQDNVYILNENTFKQALQDFDFILVKFFAPWCGHCKKLAVPYAEAAKQLDSANSSVKIAEVDCTVHKEVCQQKGIRGYPTLLFFTKGEDNSEKYTSQRTTQAIVQWVTEKSTAQPQENLGEL